MKNEDDPLYGIWAEYTDQNGRATEGKGYWVGNDEGMPHFNPDIRFMKGYMKSWEDTLFIRKRISRVGIEGEPLD